VKGLSAVLARFFKKDTAQRRLLSKGMIVLHVNDIVLHLSIMYFNPRRPTFWKCKLADDLKYGHLAIEPEYKAGLPHHLPDVGLSEQIDLSAPVAVQLSLLLKFHTPIRPFVPSGALAIGDLDDHVPMPDGNPILFWRGADVELQAAKDEAVKKREKREAETRESGGGRSQASAQASSEDYQSNETVAESRGQKFSYPEIRSICSGACRGRGGRVRQ
jgi:hypothetical protein